MNNEIQTVLMRFTVGEDVKLRIEKSVLDNFWQEVYSRFALIDMKSDCKYIVVIPTVECKYHFDLALLRDMERIDDKVVGNE